MRHNVIVQCLFVAILLGAIAPGVAAQTLPPSILTIDVENLVNYNHDTFDIQRLATSAGISPNILQPAFTNGIGIGDVIAVNGQPAKGLSVYRFEKFNSTATQTPGMAIADLARLSWYTQVIEIHSAGGTPIGTIMMQGFAQGMPPPGSPALQTVANWTIVGGTGMFSGVRGTAGNAAPPGQAGANPRQASVVEDPAFRRANGGGKSRIILNINPAQAPVGTVTGLTLLSSTVKPGGSFTATIAGTNLTDKTYFDITFRAPGSNVDVEAFNWQQGVTGVHTLAADTTVGTWTITGVRFHENAMDHFSGVYVPVSVPLSVVP